MNHRFTKALLGVTTVIAVACLDMSAPKGPASISILLLPSPSVVVGDMMRDSNGVPAPISLVAYDASGAQIGGLTSQFFITDSIRYAHLSASNVLFGDSVGLVHIVGQIGAVQTNVTPVPVTAVPDTFGISSVPDTLTAPIGVDSSSSLGLAQLGVFLHGLAQVPVTGFVVKYVLVSVPATKSGATSPAVFLIGDDGKISLADTTDGSGAASRTLVVNARNIGNEQLLAGLAVDSAVVLVSTSYKGVPVRGSPAKFVVPIRVQQP